MNFAAMGLNNGCTYGKPDAHIAAAAVGRRGVSVQVAGKNVMDTVFGNSATVVADAKNSMVIRYSNCKGQLCHAFCMVYGIF